MERPRTGRILAGVCAAIADYAKIDITVVRIVCALFTILTIFAGSIIYFILMLMIPEKKKQFNINK